MNFISLKWPWLLHFQGKQIGKLLGIAAIEKAKCLHAKRICLESNRALIPAINLYLKLGFIEIPIDKTPYARANITNGNYGCKD